MRKETHEKREPLALVPSKTEVLVFLLWSVALFAAGCVIASPQPSPSQREDVGTSASWAHVAENVDKNDLRFPDGNVIALYRFAAGKFSWRFESATSAKSVAVWFDDLESPAAVMNGVYFHEDFLPSGLLISKGKRIGSRSFDAKRSALIVFDETARLVDTSRESAPADLKEAAQSYPFLLLDGRPAVAIDSGQKARRSFIATDKGGNVYLGIAPLGDLTLYRLSRLLAEANLGLDRAVNLDGGPSSGLLVNAQSGAEIENSFVDVPNVIAAIAL